MTSNWAYNLDLLAQNGVLNYDAPSQIMGKSPRYVGSPLEQPAPFIGQIPSVPALNQPENDEFQQSSDKNNIVHPKSWKKWLFGGLAVCGLVFAGLKSKFIVSRFKKP